MSAHLDAVAVARALGGEAVGNRVSAPGPGHSRRDRSMTVYIDPDAPNGFRVTSHAGDDFRVCRDYVVAALGLPTDWRPGGADRSAVERRQVTHVVANVGLDSDADRRQRLALEIWQAARDPRGSVVEVYLALRALHLPDDIAGDVLRYHASCPWGTATTPAMVAAMRCVNTGRILGIHRTALAADGTKIDRRMLGTTAGAAVMLDAHEAVSTGLTVGEGIETCLAARQLGLRPVWALGSAGAIRTFPVLTGVEALTILGETGDGGANDRAVREVGARWVHAGAEVDVIHPRVEGDLNDALKRRARQC